MVDGLTEFGFLVAEFSAAVLTLLVLMRIVYVLSANPIGDFTQELVYLRSRDLRRAAFLVFLIILIEVAQLLYPLTIRQGWLASYDDATLFADTTQGVLILAAAVAILFVVRRYTHRALDRRIRESMETLAYLEGQRRRRRVVESGQWESSEDE